MTSPNLCSVGLKVTSLKWTGPDPEACEAPPQVPMDIEYSDAAQRSDDIGFPEDGSRGVESPVNASTKDNSQSSADRPMVLESPHKEENPQEATQDSQKVDESASQEREIATESFNSEEATQDKEERIRLQMMLPASVNFTHIYYRSLKSNWPRPRKLLVPTIPLSLHSRSTPRSHLKRTPPLWWSKNIRSV